MTVATWITLSRLLATALMLPAYYLDSELAFKCATAIFLGAVGSDVLDGFVARTFHQETPLGARLDPLVDKIFVYVNLFGLMHLGAISPIIVFPMFIRDMIVDGLRNKAAHGATILSANVWGKAKFCLQASAIFFGLCFCIRGQLFLVQIADVALGIAFLASVPGLIVIASIFTELAPYTDTQHSSQTIKLPLTNRFF